ncbi:MAG: NBR1-Ig-like domain-containing protein, partial [bacterium]|nr:NBR1-Ig-like domain-containing protein [bacterium]
MTKIKTLFATAAIIVGSVISIGLLDLQINKKNQSASAAQNCPSSELALYQAIVGDASSLTPGEQRGLSISMLNCSTVTWTSAAGIRLGSQNPQDNTIWGLNRVDLPYTVAPGQSVTFHFTVTAPSVPGNYNFQWRMLQENVAWFGQATPNIQAQVIQPTPAPTVDIKVNGSDGPITVDSGTNVNVTWSSTNATSCTASGAVSGNTATAGSTTLNVIS